jgi:hypothetical protein
VILFCILVVRQPYDNKWSIPLKDVLYNFEIFKHVSMLDIFMSIQFDSCLGEMFSELDQ